MEEKLKEKLDKMLNQTWLYNTRLHQLLSYKIDDKSVTIVTDRDWLTFRIGDMERKLKEFLEVEQDDEFEGDKGKQMILFKANESFSGLEKTILDNIKKLKEDNDFIKQANAINQSANTLINLMKTQIELVKLQKGT